MIFFLVLDPYLESSLITLSLILVDGTIRSPTKKNNNKNQRYFFF